MAVFMFVINSQEVISRPASKRRSFLDHYERCFSIFRLPKHLIEQKRLSEKPEGAAEITTCVTDTTSTSSSTNPKQTSEDDAESTVADAETSSTATNIPFSPPAPKQMKLDHTIDDDRGGESSGTRSWVARRVDLIVAPASQYAYALMGWTGSRMFNRSIRDYANKEMNMTLTSHGLFDKVKVSIVFKSRLAAMPVFRKFPDFRKFCQFILYKRIAFKGVSVGGQNKLCVASSRVRHNVSCCNSCFSPSSACQDLFFTCFKPILLPLRFSCTF